MLRQGLVELKVLCNDSISAKVGSFGLQSLALTLSLLIFLMTLECRLGPPDLNFSPSGLEQLHDSLVEVICTVSVQVEETKFGASFLRNAIDTGTLDVTVTVVVVLMLVIIVVVVFKEEQESDESGEEEDTDKESDEERGEEGGEGEE